ncbi:hypothetical protein DS6A_84 [Mycobacterium phage DS6A]|uniref:Uncharacterized protein n=1 Tax=Mycobacterium phage DS6A TaxID=45764 RepID=G8I4J4_9CAUD|nr:hypothetical protein DS6A_84 [Mycobacterium phage DS6A]AER47638.1 hypothetical protein DS6A_84 [Mycobacterium phage DS6A]
MSTGETIHTSSTGGQKAGNHVRVGLIPTDELLEVAALFGKGAEKYDDNNWRKGYPWHLSFDALCRHLFAWWGGDEFDNGEGGTGQEHLDAVIFHALVLKWFRKHRPLFDDRPNTVALTEALLDAADDAMKAQEAAEFTARHQDDQDDSPVQSLGDEHRARQWVDSDGDRWRWDMYAGRWQYRNGTPDGTAEDLAWMDDWQPVAEFGPYTPAVEKLGTDHQDRQWVDESGDRWRWDADSEEWQCRVHGLPHWGPTTLGPNPHGPFTPAPAGAEGGE